MRTACACVLLMTLFGMRVHAQVPATPAREASPPTGTRTEVETLRAELARERVMREERAVALGKRLAELEAAQSEAAVAAALQSAQGESGAADVAQPEKISFYGFMDAGFLRPFIPKRSYLRSFAPSNEGTFFLGNVNLYVDARPDEHWRALMEVRFTNLPHGSETGFGGLGGGYRRTDSTVFDSANLKFVTLGGIGLERAYVQYSYSDTLQIRAGKWFTPWGIWNIDHGSPTLIPIAEPSMIVDTALPIQQVGVEILGRYNRPPYSFGYHFTLSNGRTDAHIVDYTDNKAVGTRLFLQYSGDSEIRVGLTGFWGHTDDLTKDVVSIRPLGVAVRRTVETTDAALGLDFSLDHGGTRVRSEAVVAGRRYEPGKRYPGEATVPGSLDPDRVRYNWYLLVAQRMKWLEPYAMVDYTFLPTGRGDSLGGPRVGTILHVSAASQLKLEYGYAHYFNLVDRHARNPSFNDWHLLAARWVLAF